MRDGRPSPGVPPGRRSEAYLWPSSYLRKAKLIIVKTLPLACCIRMTHE